MNSKKICIAKITIFFVFLVSCQSNTANITACDSLLSDIPSERINTDIVLNTRNNSKEISVKEDLRFFAVNYSENVLESMPGKDLQIYIWDDSDWIQIENKARYGLILDRFNVKSPGEPGEHSYHIVYDTSLVQEPSRFCIILRAVKDPENAHLNIASYLEIKISP